MPLFNPSVWRDFVDNKLNSFLQYDKKGNSYILEDVKARIRLVSVYMSIDPIGLISSDKDYNNKQEFPEPGRKDRPTTFGYSYGLKYPAFDWAQPKFIFADRIGNIFNRSWVNRKADYIYQIQQMYYFRTVEYDLAYKLYNLIK